MTAPCRAAARARRNPSAPAWPRQLLPHPRWLCCSAAARAVCSTWARSRTPQAPAQCLSGLARLHSSRGSCPAGRAAWWRGSKVNPRSAVAWAGRRPRAAARHVGSGPATGRAPPAEPKPDIGALANEVHDEIVLERRERELAAAGEVKSRGKGKAAAAQLNGELGGGRRIARRAGRRGRDGDRPALSTRAARLPTPGPPGVALQAAAAAAGAADSSLVSLVSRPKPCLPPGGQRAAGGGRGGPVC